DVHAAPPRQSPHKRARVAGAPSASGGDEGQVLATPATSAAPEAQGNLSRPAPVRAATPSPAGTNPEVERSTLSEENRLMQAPLAGGRASPRVPHRAFASLPRLAARAKCPGRALSCPRTQRRRGARSGGGAPVLERTPERDGQRRGSVSRVGTHQRRTGPCEL